ncbi:MAG TPA: CBS domain-containing protein [Candidatus Limnocylindrales bacterium]|nr:CBS domain-containing protein [Candidatus Limnocylindrales bacterium]
MHLIFSHENSDFDAIASQIAAAKLNPDAIPVLAGRQNHNVARFLSLVGAALPFVRRDEAPTRRISTVTLVDTHRMPSYKGIKPNTTVYAIDHHPVDETLDPRIQFHGEVTGATTTILVEQIKERGLTLERTEATLFALGIYEDTGSLLYSGTTARDMQAAAWLLEQGADLALVRFYLQMPLDETQQLLLELLLTEAESRDIDGYLTVVARVRCDEYISEISAVAARLNELLDAAALFVLVDMPGSTQLVCRSRGEAVDCEAIARHFGGGGHPRAAAAALSEGAGEEAEAAIWEMVRVMVNTSPAVTRMSDLMSYGVHTVEADRPVAEVVSELRRIGHEGYPVVELGRVAGLLTHRDLDRAAEHDLGDLTVRDIMQMGEVFLRPEDTVLELERKIVESGWGQIPIVGEQDEPIGVVTRTDLIKYWADQHPREPRTEPTIPLTLFAQVLGKPMQVLVEAVAAAAQEAGLTAFVVGGVVRDLLLERPNLDLDIVTEGDAAKLAEVLASRYGGKVQVHRPFATAKWVLERDVPRAFRVPPRALPPTVDFASARNEFYEAPTALPTVYQGSIKLDLRRRDFTINTLAIQISPAARAGRILDYFGGLNDLRTGVIRVLHSLSFVDDPTRVLRAIRFEHRLGFTIEARTAALVRTSLPMLARITGERIRSEIELLLREERPEVALFEMQKRGILRAIYPDFRLSNYIGRHFRRARVLARLLPDADRLALYWHLLGIYVGAEALPRVIERMLIGKTVGDSMLAAAQIVELFPRLAAPNAAPSEIAALLDGHPRMALLAAWTFAHDPAVLHSLRRYIGQWAQVRPSHNGNDLQALGIERGPCIGKLLGRLRAAQLDGEVASREAEHALIRRLLDEGYCDDD